MERYKNLSGDSNISEYEIGGDYIKAKFIDSSVYLYNNLSAGSQNIEEMKRLAVIGRGLNGFMSRHVRKKYASKFI